MPKKQRGAWYGLPRVGCPYPVAKMMQDERDAAHQVGAYSERECEVDCFLTVLESTDRSRPFVMLDVGAGWGEWSLALAGVVANRLIPAPPDYWTLAVECAPEFYAALTQNMVHVHGEAKNAAVSDRNSVACINTGKISSQCCGSSLSFRGKFSDSWLLARLLGLYHRATNQTVRVATYTIDTLRDIYDLTPLDLVIMDVQGAELLALDGAKRTLAEKAVEWWLVGTHGHSVHHGVRSKLKESYELVLDAPAGQLTELGKDYKVLIQKGQDGIQFWKKK